MAQLSVLYTLQALLPEAQHTHLRQSWQVHATFREQATQISLLAKETLCRALCALCNSVNVPG